MDNTPILKRPCTNQRQFAPRAWRVNDFCAAYGIGRTKFYQMVGAGDITPVHFGGRTLITDCEANRLLSRAKVAAGIKLDEAGEKYRSPNK